MAFGHQGSFSAPPPLRHLVLIRTILLTSLLCIGRETWAQWVFEFVDDTRDYSEERCDRTLRLDAAGRPHIVAGDWYIHHDGVTWQFELIAPACRQPSLALDRSGYLHIAYRDATNNDLKYARALGPTPMVLTGALSNGVIILDWTAVAGAAAYWVYGEDNRAYFEPGFAPGYQYRLAMLSPTTQTWSSANGIGDPAANWTYLVLAGDNAEQELRRSNRVGEQDFQMTLRPRSGQANDNWQMVTSSRHLVAAMNLPHTGQKDDPSTKSILRVGRSLSGVGTNAKGSRLRPVLRRRGGGSAGT